MRHKIGDRVIRDSKTPLVDLGHAADEFHKGVQHGWVGTVCDGWLDSSCTQKYSVKWDNLPKEEFAYSDEFLRGCNPTITDFSRCCSCSRLNEYENPPNVGDGWMCGECRVIRSMQ